MRKRNAFIETYKKTAPFADNLSEFDEAREVVTDLIAEYEAAESADYLSFDSGGKAGEAESSANDRRAPWYTSSIPEMGYESNEVSLWKHEWSRWDLSIMFMAVLVLLGLRMRNESIRAV